MTGITNNTESVINSDAVLAEYLKLVEIYSQLANLEAEVSAYKEDLKGVKESLKLEGVDPAEACKLAKAAVKGEKEKVIGSAESLILLSNIVGS